VLTRLVKALVIIVFAASSAHAVVFNTSDPAVYAAFAAGATVQNFDTVGGVTPFAITSYVDGDIVPATAHLGGQIPGLHFHSGGANPNDVAGTPGTPVALLTLAGGIAGDARSAPNVVAPLKFDTDLLGLAAGDFLEVVFATPQNRVGVWLNPALGSAVFTALDADLLPLDSVTGSPGNFVGVELTTNSIRAISIVAAGAGFTIDDLTYGTTTPGTVPEPAALMLLALGLLVLLATQRRHSI
jgi:hypothetical protein